MFKIFLEEPTKFRLRTADPTTMKSQNDMDPQTYAQFQIELTK